jgi:hypothetical protein
MLYTDVELEERAQARKGAARNRKKRIKFSERLAFSPREFAALLGKSPNFGYRAIYEGWVKPIAGFGRMMISREEVDRFLSHAAQYNPVPKRKAKAAAAENGGGAA